MSEEKATVLDDALADILLKASESVGNAKEFVLAEVPDVVQQALLWYGVYNLVMLFVGILTLIACYKVTKKAFTDFTDKDTVFGKLHYESQGIIWAPVILANIFLPVSAIVNINLVWLKIWIAPKIWMLEYAASIVK